MNDKQLKDESLIKIKLTELSKKYQLGEVTIEEDMGGVYAHYLSSKFQIIIVIKKFCMFGIKLSTNLKIILKLMD